jgi:hypothetical protein
MICGMPPEDGGRLPGVLPGGVEQLARERRSGRRRCFITPRLADSRGSVKWSAEFSVRRSAISSNKANKILPGHRSAGDSAKE